MITLHRFEVFPKIPAQLAPLVGLAKNLWWSWNERARALFARIDPARYEALAENPLALLAEAPEARLVELASDETYLAELASVAADLDAYMTRETWFDRHVRQTSSPLASARIAYFSMEFGVHECLPVYSGGLGVLAGDHLKSASDLGLPLVGVGIAFSQGYFRQSLDAEGWQNERYPPNDWHDLPVSPVNDGKGSRVVVGVTLPIGNDPTKTREIALEAWRVDVGRVPLFLLDANLERNAPEDRALTNTLYGGDRLHRIRQEILLGTGGVRLLAALGISPTLCHMNEGHSAFLALERVRELMIERGVPFVVAAEVAAAGNVFTTHTPVPAGNDGFPAEMIAPYLAVLGQGLGLAGEEIHRIGRVDPGQTNAEFSMPVLAIRMADRYNGVSVLHGREARAMWRVLWPEIAEDEIPIASVTNGVHLATWISRPMSEFFTKHLGEGWQEKSAEPATWANIDRISDEELWQARGEARARLATELSTRMRALGGRHGRPIDPRREVPALDPNALTIGFARRFATYKRGTLLLRDAERLFKIVSRSDKPVQLVFSGKAHPQDWGGKELIRDIVRASRTDAFRGRIVFVEDYDMGVARALVAGVDVWLNTPRRPLEASGTSGMKAALNGALHASVLDGWWAEAYSGDNGFAIGAGEEYADTEYGDRVEAELLYRLLEDELVPLFYDRDAAGVPHGWALRIKKSIQGVAPVFNTTRMVREYTESLYEPASRRRAAMNDEGLSRARAICGWKSRIAAAWKDVRIESVNERGPRRIVAGEPYGVAADVHLGGLSPADVAVELWHGRLRGDHAITRGAAIPLRCVGELGDRRFRYEGEVPTRETGEHAFAVRVYPTHEHLAERFAARLVAWK